MPVAEDSEPITLTTYEIARFEITLWWSNIPTDDPNAWWVYLLAESEYADPCYIGMARNVRRRLAEHRRGWMAGSGHATLIATWSEAEARRLETALIAGLNPRNNTQKPILSWIERTHYERIRGLWDAEELLICPGCRCICRSWEGSFIPESEPNENCTEHAGPARYAWAHSIVKGLMAVAGVGTTSHA